MENQAALKETFSRWRLVCGVVGLTIWLGLAARTPVASEAPGALTTGTNIGAAILPGQAMEISGGVRVSSAGTGVGGGEDQCYFLAGERRGDFDVRVRVARLDNVNVWAKAGLMVRESLEPRSPFAAALTTPTLAGSFLQARTADGGLAVMSGAFPANLPNAWLRLRREGSRYGSFASIDGEHWQSLGSASFEATNAIWLGLAVSSQVTNRVVTAEFVDFGDTPGASTEAMTLPWEGVGPSTRRTGLAITEIMYRSNTVGVSGSLEFIELFNSNPFFEDVSGYELSGEISYVFPSGTVIPGGGFVVVGKDPETLRQAYGLEQVLGPFSGSLPRHGLIRVQDKAGSVLLEVPYSNRPPWPVAADGTGHSLVLARPSYGQGEALAWAHSRVKGGSPGQVDAMPCGPLELIVLNECLANTSTPGSGFIELFNKGTDPVDLSRCGVSDSPTLVRFRVPDGTVVPAQGHLVFTEAQLGFGLNAGGESLFFSNPSGERVIAAMHFEAQARGVSWGRSPDGSDEWFPQAEPTPARSTQGARVPEVVINEIMFHPISGNPDDEFVELYNRSTATIDLSGWRFTEGIEFVFPAGARLESGAYMVVAKNALHLRSLYPSLNAANTVGDFSGQLSNNGERLALVRPDAVPGGAAGLASTNLVLVDTVVYHGQSRFSQWADGGGSSLERVDPDGNGMRSSNWQDSDETDKAAWTTVESTARLERGSGTPDSLQIIVLGAGECLIDNVDVVPAGGTNLVANGDFSSGLAPWTPSGDHIRSNLEAQGGVGQSACLHLRASNQGEPLANHVRVLVRQSSQLSLGREVRLRAQVRWLAGSPEVLLRLKGNYLEAYGRLPVSTSPGTPGMRNSRARADAGPSIFDVTHFPVLPATNEPVRVMARLEDKHGLAAVTLHWRLDPSPNLVDILMQDDGANGDARAGDGVFTGVIPAPQTNALVAFTVEATCAGAAPATTHFPPVAPGQEALIRFGETAPASGFGTYRLWFTAGTIKNWSMRPVLSNEELDGTFVYGNARVVYNIGARYSGSPWHQGGYNSPLGNPCTYAFSTPGDEPVLGATSFNKLHAIGNTPGDDSSLQHEQIAYWMVRQLGLPWNYQRYVQVYVNGQRRGSLMEDTQVPSADSLEEHFPKDADGLLYKLNGWYEPDSAGGSTFHLASWCTLNRQTDSEGQPSLASYRWNWAPRATGPLIDPYSDVIALVAAANTDDGGPYEENLDGVADMRQWLRTFAIEHAVGNWDSFGNRNAQNMYAYKPIQDRWKLLIWDFNIVLGNSGSDGPSGDDLFQLNPADRGMRRIYSNSAFVRTYLQTIREIALGPMASAQVDPVIDARQAAFRASGVAASGQNTLKSWIASRRKYLQNYLTNFQVGFSVTAPAATQATTDRNWATLSGIAPLEIASIRVNDISYPVSWTNLLEWQMTVPLLPGSNRLEIQGVSPEGQPVSSANAVLAVLSTAAQEAARVVINEILVHPTVPGAEFIELLNTSPVSAVDLSMHRLEGVDYTFPAGSILRPGQLVVVTKDHSAFIQAYGTAVAPIGTFPGSLKPDGEMLRLLRPSANGVQSSVLDTVTFGMELPWPTAPREPGVALQLLDPALDNNRPSSWGAISTVEIAQPGWKFVSVTGRAGTSSRLLLYHSPFEAPRDPLRLEGRWDGVIDFPNSPYQMTVLFEASTNNTVSGQFLDSGTSIPLIVKVTAATNVAFAFPATYGVVSWQGTMATDGLSITGRFQQVVQGQSVTASFTVHRLIEAEARPGGTVLIDDLSLVPGEVPGAGSNLVQNGDFESALAGTWTVASNHVATSLRDDRRHDGTSSLQLVASYGGADESTAMWQDLPGLVPGQTYTLSYWYLPSSVGHDLTVRLGDSALVSTHSIRPGRSATPGEPNSVLRPPSAPPKLILSEIMPLNRATIADRSGHFEPWLELYNAGTDTIRLDEFGLSDRWEEPGRWSFPAGASLQPGAYMTVWLDSAVSESRADEIHAAFRLEASEGVVLLTWQNGGQVLVIDSMTFHGLGVDQSYGLIEEEGGSGAVVLTKPSPGYGNSGAVAEKPIRINEWMATNQRTLLNPANEHFDDWFELYNPNLQDVDLSGCFLSDDLDAPRKWAIPSGTKIGGHGYLLVWADEQTEVKDGTSALHANFKLSQGGELIALFNSAGALIDSVDFGIQASDVSEGRWPDGDPSQILSFHVPTPGTGNRADSGNPLQITRFAWTEDGNIVLGWASEPGARYQVQSCERLDGFGWTNLGLITVGESGSTEARAPRGSGTGQQFFRVVRLR